MGDDKPGPRMILEAADNESGIKFEITPLGLLNSKRTTGDGLVYGGCNSPGEH